MGTGSLSSAFLPLGFPPFMETIVSKAATAEIVFDVAFGDVAGKDGHLTVRQVFQLFLSLPDAAVKFLNIHCLLNK